MIKKTLMAIGGIIIDWFCYVIKCFTIFRIETIEATKVTEEELSIFHLHQKLVKLYSEKDITTYTELLKYILSLSVQLDLHFVLKYFGVRPVVAADERMQFQEIFKCLAKKDDNGEWFLNFVSLYCRANCSSSF